MNRSASILDDLGEDDLSIDSEFEIAVASASSGPRADALSPDAEFDFAFALDDDEADTGDSPTPFDVEFDLAMMPRDREPAKVALTSVAPPAVVGDDLASTNAFFDAVAERAASSQGPSLVEDLPRSMQQRQTGFSTSQVFGPAGESTVITLNPQCVFRVEKLMATDTATPPGTGTAIVQIAIGQRVQRPGSTAQGTLTQFFAETALANGIKLDTAHPYEAIAITVRFIQSCSFSMVLSGTAEMD